MNPEDHLATLEAAMIQAGLDLAPTRVSRSGTPDPGPPGDNLWLQLMPGGRIDVRRGVHHGVLSVWPPIGPGDLWDVETEAQVTVRPAPGAGKRARRLLVQNMAPRLHRAGLRLRDDEEGRDGYSSRWTAELLDDLAVVVMVVALTDVELDWYPDGGSPENFIPLSTDQVEALVALGVPFEEREE